MMLLAEAAIHICWKFSFNHFRSGMFLERIQKTVYGKSNKEGRIEKDRFKKRSKHEGRKQERRNKESNVKESRRQERGC